MANKEGEGYKPPTFFKTASPDRYVLLREFAKENRNNPTDAETFLWKQLKGKVLGVKFYRQYAIYDFIADFICLEKQLIIEVDGEYHASESQMKEDKMRTEIIEQMGFSVLRFTNGEVLNEPEKVISKIKTKILQ